MWNDQNPVNWFEIPVAELDRAKAFYEGIFGIEMPVHEMGPLTMAWFPMSENGFGATGTLIKADSYVPSYHGSMVYFSVEDIEAILEKVKDHGGKIVNPKMGIGEHGFVAHFEDSEGNRVAVHSRK